MEASQLNSLAKFMLISLSLTLVYSLLVMLGGKNIFKKASKKEITIFYPIFNLFTLLEISEISIFMGVLFFVPVLNVISICFMFYKLGTAFNVSILYKIGLIFLPFIFYPLLAFSNKQYKFKDHEYFKALESAKNDNINLMTQEEINKLNEIQEEEMPEVDSIFKANVQPMQEVTPYKAVKIDLLGMEKLKNNNIQSKQNGSDDNDNVEFLDL